MNITKLFLLILFVTIVFDGSAQHECGSDLLHRYLMNTDSNYFKAFEKRQQEILELSGNNLHVLESVTIPVVVHVIHLGEPEGTGSNISDSQILNALQGVNERFANMNGLGIDTEIQFCLASRDPFGCPTDGIVRVDGTVVPNYASNGIDYPDGVDCGAAPDIDIKALSTWPILEYYNIWVVHSICEGWAGYAYYPNGQSYDGTVIVDNYMTYGATTLTHELGHGFNLAHTFNGDNGNSECPANNDCLVDGDYVCDTPPHKQGDCGVTNPCTTEGVWDNSRFNFMSYCGTTNRFTPDQKDRMQNTLLTFPRMNLLSSPGCTPSTFSTTIDISPITCVGECNGIIHVEPQCPGTYTYLWDIGETVPTIINLCPGIYTVEITNEQNFAAQFSMELEEADDFDITADSLYFMCEGNEIQLSADGAFEYSWNPSTGLDDATNADPICDIDITTNYVVTGTSVFGCLDSATVQVTVFDNPVVSIQQNIDTLFAMPEGLIYQWYLNGELIDGETGPYYVAEDDGLISVVGTNDFGCSDSSEVFDYVGIEGLQGFQEHFLYPNPGNGKIVVGLTRGFETNEPLLVYDDAGRLVHTENTTTTGKSTTHEFDLSHLSEGYYVLQIGQGISAVEFKFTIRR